MQPERVLCICAGVAKNAEKLNTSVVPDRRGETVYLHGAPPAPWGKVGSKVKVEGDVISTTYDQFSSV